MHIHSLGKISRTRVEGMNLNLLRESPLNVRDQLMRREKSEFTLHASTKCHVSVDKCASGGDGERKGNDAESTSKVRLGSARPRNLQW